MNVRNLLLVALLAVGCKAGDVGLKGWSASEAEPRIVANLRLQFPSLRDVEFSVDSLRASGVEGMMEGDLVLPDERRQAFLLDTESGLLYLLAAPPVDVSRDAETVLAEIRTETENRHRELMAEVANLPVRGDANAPVTIVEFSDFQCPYCARASQTIAEILSERAEQVRLIYVHFPLPNHPWARPAAIASACAAQQSNDAFWALHDRYFDQQRALTTDNVIDQSRTWVSETGVDLAAWSTCVNDTSSAAHRQATEMVDDNLALGERVGVSGTPHFVINGRALGGALPKEEFDKAIEASLRAESEEPSAEG